LLKKLTLKLEISCIVEFMTRMHWELNSVWWV